MGDDDISRDSVEKLKNNLNALKDSLVETLESYTRSLQSYSDSMHRSLAGVQYFSHGDYIGVHQNAKNTAVNQVGFASNCSLFGINQLSDDLFFISS